jgi:hypothetical protein
MAVLTDAIYVFFSLSPDKCWPKPRRIPFQILTYSPFPMFILISFDYKHILQLKLVFNPSAWRHLIPGQYCAVGGFSTWVFKFEPESAKHFKYV